ncbi:MAG: hypothetical protein R2748_26890 [Bryobacterales bacterium]
MSTQRLVTLAAVYTLFAGTAPGQNDLRALFPRQVSIFVNEAGLSRLDLPASIAEQLDAERGDLRIVDADGRETPYLLDTAQRLDGGGPETARLALKVVDVERERRDRRDAPALYRETYVLDAPADRNELLVWDLVIETRAPEFVRRMKVSLLSDATENQLAAGPLFRIPASGVERTRMTLPRFGNNRLKVEIEGEDASYLEPTFRLEHSREFPLPEQDRVELSAVSRQEEGSTTVVELDRPRGLHAFALQLETPDAAFSRRVEVWDAGPGATAGKLGEALLYRIPGQVMIEGDQIPLGQPTGARYRVVIHNQDSPPLSDLRFTSLSQRLRLLFTLEPKGSDAPAGTLLFGGGRAPRPRYDLSALEQMIRERPAARNQALIYDATPVTLGPVEPNPAFAGAPTLSFAMRPGDSVDPGPYTHQRVLTLQPSDEGLSTVRLRLEDLALAQPDLRDVRIVDAQSRQWAYVSELAASRETASLAVSGPERKADLSEYTLTPPVANAPLDRITLMIDAEFIDRAFELFGTQGGAERMLAQGRLERRVGEQQPIPVALPAGTRVDELRLAVVDGNDAPLRIESATGEYSAAHLYIAAPTGVYTLLLGNPDDTPPSYELETARAAVLAARGAEAQVGPLEDNPGFRRASRLTSETGLHQALLWGALILVVAGLSVVTLRAVKQPTDGSA